MSKTKRTVTIDKSDRLVSLKEIKDPIIEMRNERFKHIKSQIVFILSKIEANALTITQIDRAYAYLDNVIETSHLDQLLNDSQEYELSTIMSYMEPHLPKY